MTDRTVPPPASGPRMATPPVWFVVIAVVGLLWFLMDTSMFFMRMLMSDEFLKAMPEAQQHLYRNMPGWVNVVFGCEVFGGVFGCLGLLLRRRWATPLFVVSLLGVVSQTFHIYFLSDAIRTMGIAAIAMPMVAILIGVGMILLARSATAKGWLR